MMQSNGVTDSGILESSESLSFEIFKDPVNDENQKPKLDDDDDDKDDSFSDRLNTISNESDSYNSSGYYELTEPYTTGISLPCENYDYEDNDSYLNGCNTRLSDDIDSLLLNSSSLNYENDDDDMDVNNYSKNQYSEFTDNNNAIYLTVAIGSKCRPTEHLNIDSLDFAIFIHETGNGHELQPAHYIVPTLRNRSAEEEIEIQQEREDILHYQEQFPSIFDDEFVNSLSADNEEQSFGVQTDLETDTIRHPFYNNTRVNNNYYGFNLNSYITPFSFQNYFDGAENNFNHISTTSNIHRPPISPSWINSTNTSSDSQNVEFYNLQESRYIIMQFRKIRNGWVPQSGILAQLDDNEINRLYNSGHTINAGVFNRINFNTNRLVMYI